MSDFAWLVMYCALILLASLAGGWIPIVITLTHKRMELAVSFVAGVMLGVGVLHMLPHAIAARMEAVERENANTHFHFEAHSFHTIIGPLLLWMIGGFLVMFLIERFFRFHHHDAPDQHEAHDHGDHAHDHHHPSTGVSGMSWAGAAVGLSLHSLIEGVALASSMAAVHQGHGHGAALAGLATFLVIFLHKPFDAMTIGTLMSIGKRSIISRHLVNVGFSLFIPVGVLLFHLGFARMDGGSEIAAYALAFSAGTFLCISMSDLLPELQFHQHDRVKLSLSLLLGLALAWGISTLEHSMHEGHDHQHSRLVEPFDGTDTG